MAERDEAAGTAKPYLEMLADAERCDSDYHSRCDNIDKLYSDLKTLAAEKTDRQFQMFWANIQVLKNAIYSRAPVPVVTSRFRDRKPLPRKAADILERALLADFEADDVHETLVEVRDDYAINARGVVWLRIVDREGVEVPSVEHVERKDFRHGYGRKWAEVPWVARRAWLTKEQVKKRFGEVIPEGMSFQAQDSEKRDGFVEYARKKAAVWEIWHKDENVVVWVSEGVADCLDKRDPWMTLKGFFPCPRPAYGTLTRGTLTPVPSMVYYKDQLEEINLMTARISALAQALRVRFFYGAGAGDVADAIEAAFRSTDDRAIGVPINAMSALGPNASLSDAMVWLPVREVAETIVQLIALRRQLIEDVYEISGISDIMRGNTDANETLGAQQLKSQYGSIRVQDQQAEMVRLARDVTRMKAEIMAENVGIDDLLLMAQVDDLPSQADVAEQAQPLVAQLQQIQQQAQQQLQAMAMQGAPQEAAQPVEQQAQEAAQPLMAQLQEMQQQITKEAVAELLTSQRVRPFVLEIETDSTIQPDEMQEKQKRVEFMSALGPMLNQGVQAMQLAPQMGKFVAESIRFVASGFRAGRQMDDAIDELAEQFANYQPPAPPGVDPAAAQAEAQTKQAEAQAKVQVAQVKAEADTAKAQAQVQASQMDMQARQMEAQAEAERAPLENEKIKADIALIFAKIEQLGAQTQIAATQQAIDVERGAAEDERAEKQHALAEKKTASDMKVAQQKAQQPKGPGK